MSSLIEQVSAALAGRYRVDRELGFGGMATVYHAHDAKHERSVAIKVLRPELAAALGADRFLQEIRVTANLQHPHILPLHDSGQANSFLYYVMPFVEGESLRDKLSRDQRLPIDESVTMAKAIASALDYAHRQNIVHRDIKPENVLLSDGLPVIADFGIARAVSASGNSQLTETGMAIGTAAYMSPEQATGEATVDGRTDTYALACVLYEMLVGEPPYTGPNAQAIIAKRFTDPVPSPRRLRDTIPPALDSAIQKALSTTPADRFATAAEFVTALTGGPTAPIEVKEPLSIAPANRTPYVGRDDERRELLERLDQMIAGQGSLILVGGEPGVGKTRLAQEILLEAQRRELLCFIGHCYEAEGTPPYIPYIETLEYAMRAIPEDRFRESLGDSASEVARIMPELRRMFPDIPDPVALPPEQQRRHLFNAYRDFVNRGTAVSPFVVLLDDLHWADESSLLLLEHLAQYVPSQRMLMIGTYRDVELDVHRPFEKTLDRLTRQRLASRMSLRRLPEAAVQDLLASLAGQEPPPTLVRAIFRETEGNPFFVEEVFEHLDEEGRLFDDRREWRQDLAIDELDIPEGIRLAIGRRLERVTEACRNVLTTAAVIGPKFEHAIIEKLGDADPNALLDALEEAERAKLLNASTVKRETTYRFAHELIRHTLLHGMSFPRRQRRHQKIAEAMLDVYGASAESHAADIAHHLYQAGAAADPDETIRYMLMAGEQALGSSAFDEAFGHFDRVLTTYDELDTRVQATLHLKRGVALRGTGNWHDAMSAWKSALDLFEQLGDGDALLEVSRQLVPASVWLDDLETGLRASTVTLGATSPEALASRGELAALRSYTLGFMGNYPDAIAAAKEAERIGEECGDARVQAMAASNRAAVAHSFGEINVVIEQGRTAAKLFRALGDPFEEATALWPVHFGLIIQGRLSEAMAMCEAQARAANEYGNISAWLMNDMIRPKVRVMTTGALDEFALWGKRAFETWRRAGPWYEFGAHFAAMCDFFRGNWQAAVERIQESADRFEPNHWKDCFWSGLFLVQAYQGDPAAMHLLAKNEGRIPRQGEESVIGAKYIGFHLPQGLVLLGRRQRAAEFYDMNLHAAELGWTGDWYFNLQTQLGICAAAGEQWDLAETHFETALRQLEESPNKIAEPDARRWYAWMLLDRAKDGDKSGARQLLHEAIDLYKRIGMPKHVDLTKELLVRARA